MSLNFPRQQLCFLCQLPCFLRMWHPQPVLLEGTLKDLIVSIQVQGILQQRTSKTHIIHCNTNCNSHCAMYYITYCIKGITYCIAGCIIIRLMNRNKSCCNCNVYIVPRSFFLSFSVQESFDFSLKWLLMKAKMLR